MTTPFTQEELDILLGIANAPPEPDPPDPNADLEGMPFETLDLMRSQLMGTKTDYDQLTEAELQRFIAINARMRMTQRVAAKPKADGNRAPRKRNEQSLDDLLNI